MVTLSIGIDVPDLEAGIRFYSEAFGFTRKAEPAPGVAVLQLGDATVCLMERKPGTQPSPGTKDLRRYERHWTPVHMDLHVDDFAAARRRAVQAGAVEEQVFEHPEHGSAAFCSDPFGHGFCLLARKS